MVSWPLFLLDSPIVGSNISKDVSFVRNSTVGYWLRTCFYSYKFLFSVSAALLADHRHTHRSTSTAVTTRTAINSAIPQGTRFYRDLCTTPFGISYRCEDILSKDAAFVPSSTRTTSCVPRLRVVGGRPQASAPCSHLSPRQTS